jgi:hypothetical protein
MEKARGKGGWQSKLTVGEDRTYREKEEWDSIFQMHSNPTPSLVLPI